MTGATLSRMTMVCAQVEILPHKSFACQVLTIVALQGIVPVTTSELVITIAFVGVQLSVAVATPVAGGLILVLQVRLRLAGQVITGLTWSK